MHNDKEDIVELVHEVQPHWSDECQQNINKAKQIFLAGTIDMGGSRDWQSEYIQFFKDNYRGFKELYIYNPRRSSFPSIDSPYFENEIDYQINWELDHLERADIIIMNILPDSKSPISLMELGAFGRGKHKAFYVICPKTYYRYNNVKVFCERYGIPLFDDEEIFVTLIEKLIF